MEYYPTTTFGLSEITNLFGLIAALYGVGQGSTDGPLRWAFISNLLLKVYHKMSEGCQITGPTQAITVRCNTNMFVDYATLLHNDTEFDIPATKSMQNMQHNTELWGRLLWTTGGLLKFSKSVYFMIIWAFETSGCPYINPEHQLPANTVQVSDAHGSTTTLYHITKQDDIKMLGVKKQAALEEIKEYGLLLDRSITYVDAICTCPLKPHEAWLSYKTVYLLAILYLLSTTSLDEK
eukprot:8379675-Ditylum_brightwellii.AAC.2